MELENDLLVVIAIGNKIILINIDNNNNNN